jgi:hypothetical protein
MILTDQSPNLLDFSSTAVESTQSRVRNLTGASSRTAQPELETFLFSFSTTSSQFI